MNRKGFLQKSGSLSSFKAMRVKFVTVILFLPLLSFANFDFNSNCQEAYDNIINLKIEKGKELIAKERKEHPDNKITVLLDNYCDFLTLIITEERTKYDAWKDEKPKRLAEIESTAKNSPWFLYSKAEINLQWAFVEIKFGDNMKAAIDINKSYTQLQSNEKKFPGFIPTKKCLGLLHALIGNIPDNYKWAADLIGVKGTVKEGIAELQNVLLISEKAGEFSFLETESLFYLSFIQLNLNNDEKEQEKILKKMESRSNAPLLVYAAAGMALHTGKNDKCLEILSQCNCDRSSMSFHYLDYLRGVALMNMLDTSASTYFRKYSTEFNGINFIRTAYRNLAWCALIQGDVNSYKSNMELVKVKGNTMTDEDKQALKEAKEGIIPDVNLLRSRLLFDGGYYDKAMVEVLKADPLKFTSTRDAIEFEYRVARIHHKLNENEKAIEYYKLTIKSGEKYKYYFAANSALQLGLIYEKMNDKVNAKRWFSKCIAMKDHEYQDSIELKAKAGLSRVN